VSLISVPRLERTLERFGKRFLEKVFSPAEIAYSERKRRPSHNLASRFAAKCAGRSILHTRRARGIRLRDFEVVRKRGGEPTLVLSSAAAPRGTEWLRFSLSMTHDANFALASVWLEASPGGSPDLLESDLGRQGCSAAP
jgi:holo-[acyl-carrier protein] synthase